MKMNFLESALLCRVAYGKDFAVIINYIRV